MPLFNEDESFPERPVTIILVGTPFSYKTSLAITANNPLNFDLERGSERAHGRVKTYRINDSWKEVEDDLQAGLLTNFKSAIIDTAGSLVDDYLWEYGRVIKYTKNDMQNWGTVKDLFKKFISKIRGTGLDLVVISHEKSKDKNDETVYDLDISGGGKQLLLRSADQIGFIYKKDFKEGGQVVTKTILTFWPTANLPFCKNVAAISDIVLPDCKSPEWNGFLDRMVIIPTRKAIAEMSEDQAKALELIQTWHETIDAVQLDDANLKALSTDISQITEEHLKKQVRAYLSAHLKKVEWKWDAPNKVFVPVNPPDSPVDDKPLVTAEDMVKEAEAQRASLNEPPTEDLFASTEGK